MMSDLLQKINKRLGKEVIFKASNPRFALKKIPTGILSLDLMLMGGVARGRWIEVYGDWAGLKTTFALKVIASGQKMGFPALYIDKERTVTKLWMRHNGVDTSPEMLDIALADTGEETIDIMEVYLRNGEHKVIVLDSIAAMLPQRVEKSSATDEHMGLEGKMTSAMTRKLTSLNNSGVALIMVNQTRDAIGRFFGGTPKVTPGGRALGFYSAQRLEVIRGKLDKRDKVVNGKKVKIVVGRTIFFNLKKDKTGAQEEQTCEIYYDMVNKTIDYSRDLLTNCIIHGFVKKTQKTPPNELATTKRRLTKLRSA